MLLTHLNLIDMHHKPFHLKYRPSTIADLIGQPIIQATLGNAIKSNKIANAYLLEGGRGTGKTSTARILAKSLNCLAQDSPTITPCGNCLNCKSIENSNSMDVFELDAASNNGVDDIRRLIDSAQLSRMQARYRVFLMDEVHFISRSGQAALLKTLEEPPQGVVFLLCTTDPEKLSEPIISRCLHLRFGRIGAGDIAKRLAHIAVREKIDVSNEAIHAIASLSKGGMRDALQTLEQLSTLGIGKPLNVDDVRQCFKQARSEQLLEIVKGVLSGDVGMLMMESHALIEQGLDPQSILEDLLAIYRDLYVLDLCGREGNQANVPLISSLSRELLRKLLPLGSHTQIEAGLEALQKSEAELKYSPNAAIWLEICLLRLASSGVF